MLGVPARFRYPHETFKAMRNEHGCHEIGRRVTWALVYMVMDRQTNVKANRLLYISPAWSKARVDQKIVFFLLYCV